MWVVSEVIDVVVAAEAATDERLEALRLVRAFLDLVGDVGGRMAGLRRLRFVHPAVLASGKRGVAARTTRRGRGAASRSSRGSDRPCIETDDLGVCHHTFSFCDVCLPRRYSKSS